VDSSDSARATTCPAPARHKRARVDRLVRRLRAMQEEERLTWAELAQRLGVSVAMVGMVYTGERMPGRKFLRGVLRAFPCLRDEVYLFLLRDISKGEVDDVLS
jgi:transcriptional regulator with XRE-family HTH domain